MRLQATTSQTVGPYFKIGLEWLHRENLVGERVSGERVTIQGRVLDADGLPVPDAMLEIWQANAHGKYDHPDDKRDKPLEPGFKGFGRIPVNAEGVFRFFTIKPGAVPGPGGREQAPHIVVSIFMRGLLRRLVTRIYFRMIRVTTWIQFSSAYRRKDVRRSLPKNLPERLHGMWFCKGRRKRYSST